MINDRKHFIYSVEDSSRKREQELTYLRSSDRKGKEKRKGGGRDRGRPLFGDVGTEARATRVARAYCADDARVQRVASSKFYGPYK